MIVISHRGFWLDPSEKNKREAFTRSFESGFGTETDVRDHNGALVIAHDVVKPNENLISFDEFLGMAASLNQPLAINIKADGLASLVKEAMEKHRIQDWFVFDMSVPDMRHHLAVGNRTFTRMSEVEMQPAWLTQCEGVWLDSFADCWFDLQTIDQLLSQGKRVCLVSPELHKRPHLPFWSMIAPLAKHPALILCTDLPTQAQTYFELSK